MNRQIKILPLLFLLLFITACSKEDKHPRYTLDICTYYKDSKGKQGFYCDHVDTFARIESCHFVQEFAEHTMLHAVAICDELDGNRGER